MDTRQPLVDIGRLEARLAKAISAGPSATRDAAPLIRQALALGLRPDISALDEATLDEAGISLDSDGRASDSTPWFPSWLAGHRIHLEDAIAARPVARLDVSSPADPIVSVGIGFDRYRTPAQRDAVRAALRMSPGDTMAVVLPTGTGKSLVGQARALAGRGTTVVIVPTVALALDQERLMREAVLRDRASVDPTLPQLPRALAYHGGLRQEERALIREQLRSGDQRLLFCSPEAAVGSLRWALDELASRGALDGLVVDECHLVDAWGESFRPEFQLLPALRRRLLRVAAEAGQPPLVTILLTATMTQRTQDTLRALFDLPDEHLVEQAVLRPEPRFLVGRCATTAERRRRLVETVAVAPRPAIVYTSVPDDAEALVSHLRDAGFTRVAAFTGRSTPEERHRVLTGFAGPDGDVDVVVATSAFGLGVDVPDVRTIIHACIPESVDRFYQEVGRGGRDGCAAASIFLPVIGGDTPSEDERIAVSLSTSSAIGPDKGANRWSTMRTGARLAADGLVLDVTVRPARANGFEPEVQYLSDKNTAWNWSTLNLLARAGCVNLALPRPPAVDEESPRATTSAPSTSPTRATEVIALTTTGAPPYIGEKDTLVAAFEATVRGARASSALGASESLGRVRAMAAGALCPVDALQQEYRRWFPEGGSIGPAGICVGCAACRVAESRGPTDLHTAPQTRLFPVHGRGLLSAGPDMEPTLVPLPTDQKAFRTTLKLVLSAALDLGARHIVLVGAVPGFARPDRVLRTLPVHARLTTTVGIDSLSAAPPVPWIAIVAPGRTPTLDLLRAGPRPGIIAFPDDAVDPREPGRGIRLSAGNVVLPSELGEAT